MESVREIREDAVHASSQKVLHMPVSSDAFAGKSIVLVSESPDVGGQRVVRTV
jgi:hypothetical protein